MSALASHGFPIRADIAARLTDTWEAFGRPGTWYTAEERLGFAELARSVRSGLEVEVNDAASAVVVRIAGRPATTTRSWVDEMVEALAEEQYVELMGISARVVMGDTFLRLLGLEPMPFPEPQAGQPSRIRVEPRPKKVRSWIAVGPTLVPPFTQVLVPDENAITYPLIETLYMTGHDMQDPNFRRGDLHRTQIELVASTLSYGNECFY
ncbi:MAG: hypothetical protein OEQ47_02610 [Acidimicrobiia bacterium]|nr:hypothetical protein [Acidimicrobiia bacterium]